MPQDARGVIDGARLILPPPQKAPQPYIYTISVSSRGL
jgi:hypothetical protein